MFSIAKRTQLFFYVTLLSVLVGCGGGGSTSTSSNTTTTTGGGGNTTPPAPADRFVISGNNDGTLSIFRANSMTGYATAMAYYNTGGGFSIQQAIYDAGHKRLVVLSTNQIFVLGFDPDTGTVTAIDSRSTSGNSSHLALNATGTEAYVASGTSSGQAVDAYGIDASTGVLSPRVSSTLSVDPDNIKLNPDGNHLYVLSQSAGQILIFGVNSDNSLATSPATVSTGSSPTSLDFSPSGTKAYLTLATSSNNLITYDVGSDGGLTQAATYTSSNNTTIAQALSSDGSNLYVLDGSNKKIDHYTIDAASGIPTYIDSTSISFSGDDLALSYTGKQLYVGSSTDYLVSTFDVNSNSGSLTEVESVRAFNAVDTVTAIGGAGALEPKPTYLLAPDKSGLSRFSVASDGMLTLAATENTTGALIDGEVAVDYTRKLLLGAGQDASNHDYITSYTFDPLAGTTTAVSAPDVTPYSTASFQRVGLDRSGRAMYVLDENYFDSTTHPTGTVWTYRYSSNGTLDTSPYDTDSVGEGPENMTLNPAGSYLYSINSFGDNIYYYRVDFATAKLTKSGTVTPGNTGLGVGRPLDMQFHPDGRYAYVSLEQDSEIDTWTVNTNGDLSNVTRLSTKVSGAGTGPGPIAVHPNGKYVYNGERLGTYDIVVYAVNTGGDHSLTYQSRTVTAGLPTWLTVDPQGKFLLARYSDASVEVFSIDPSTGNLTSIQKISAGSTGGFLPTMTLVSPLQ